MIEVDLEDIFLWALGLALVTVVVLRVFFKLRQLGSHGRDRRSVYYCNVCVKYFHEENEPRFTACPSCKRQVKRGRRKNMG